MVLPQRNCRLYLRNINFVDEGIGRSFGGYPLNFFERRFPAPTQRERKRRIRNGRDGVIDRQTFMRRIACGIAVGYQCIVQRLDRIKAARRVSKVLLLGPLGGLFPMFVGLVHSAEVQINSGSATLDHKAIGTTGCLLHVLFPVSPGCEIHEQRILLIA